MLFRSGCLSSSRWMGGRFREEGKATRNATNPVLMYRLVMLLRACSASAQCRAPNEFIRAPKGPRACRRHINPEL